MSHSLTEHVETPTISYANYPVGTAANVAADRVNQLKATASSMLVDTDDDDAIARMQDQLAARLQASQTMSSAVNAAQSRGFAQTIDSKCSNWSAPHLIVYGTKAPTSMI